MPEFTISAMRPVVVMDVSEYEEIQDRLERLDFLESKTLKRDAEEARKELEEGKTVSLDTLRTKLYARRTIKSGGKAVRKVGPQ